MLSTFGKKRIHYIIKIDIKCNLKWLHFIFAADFGCVSIYLSTRAAIIAMAVLDNVPTRYFSAKLWLSSCL